LPNTPATIVDDTTRGLCRFFALDLRTAQSGFNRLSSFTDSRFPNGLWIRVGLKTRADRPAVLTIGARWPRNPWVISWAMPVPGRFSVDSSPGLLLAELSEAYGVPLEFRTSDGTETPESRLVMDTRVHGSVNPSSFPRLRGLEELRGCCLYSLRPDYQSSWIALAFLMNISAVNDDLNTR
jgi:hypothetical protein